MITILRTFANLLLNLRKGFNESHPLEFQFSSIDSIVLFSFFIIIPLTAKDAFGCASECKQFSTLGWKMLYLVPDYVRDDEELRKPYKVEIDHLLLLLFHFFPNHYWEQKMKQ